MATYRLEFVNCGSPRCERCKRGGVHHGPYWYAYWKEEGRTRSSYIGKRAPRGKADPNAPPPSSAKIPKSNDAWGVLGLERGAPWDDVRRVYRRASFAAHPDRGGKHATMVALNKAFAELRKHYDK